MSDTTGQDKKRFMPHKVELNKEDRLTPERKIDDEDNLYLKHRDDPTWPKAIPVRRPSSKLKPEHLYSSKQIRGIRYGK